MKGCWSVEGRFFFVAPIARIGGGCIKMFVMNAFGDAEVDGLISFVNAFEG